MKPGCKAWACRRDRTGMRCVAHVRPEDDKAAQANRYLDRMSQPVVLTPRDQARVRELLDAAHVPQTAPPTKPTGALEGR